MPVHVDFLEGETSLTLAPPPPNNSLDPYIPSSDKPWNAARVAHLYRRLGYGATYAQIQAGLQMTPSALIDQILDEAANLGSPPPPYWAAYTSADYDNNTDLYFEHQRLLRQEWLAQMLNEGIRAKMAFFWHNHFATELQNFGCNSYLWDYYSLLNEYAFGNFRTFVRQIGQSGAMLTYLNGNQNVAGSPNENYARELMELFTMGESNGYSQADIVNMARALTGWQANQYSCTAPYFNSGLHDNGQKTIFGQTSNYGFTTAHNLIFSARGEQVSHFITAKLYRHFIYQAVDATIVDGLATTFKNSNWELLPVLKQLIKSEHFFDDRMVNARLKNPLETMLPLLKMTNANFPTHVTEDWFNAIAYWSYQLGQEIFNPPNVAGWPGYHKWINESTLTARWNYSGNVAYALTLNDELRENLRALAIALTNESNNPTVIVTALADYYMGQTLLPVHLNAAVINFKANIPENYFADGSWNLYWDEAPYQIVNMLFYLVRLPEFQLT